MPRLTLLLPTYNERDNIIPLIEAMQRQVADLEIVVIDDSSPDGTGELVRERAAHDPRVRLISRPYGAGLTSAFRDGAAAAAGDCIAWCDCDFSHPPDVLPHLLTAIDTGADVAVASRYASGAVDARDDRLAVFASRVVNTVARLLLTGTITDYTSGFVMARRAVIAAVPFRGDYGEYCIDFLYRAHRAGFKVCEVPYVSPSRRSGASKTATGLTGFLRRMPQYLRTIWRLRHGA